MATREDATRMANAAIDAIPVSADTSKRALSLCRLGCQLNEKYVVTGAPAYLDEAIRILRDAVHVAPEDDPNLPKFLYDLSGQFHDRYQRQRSVPDLEEAIRIMRDAIDATSDNDPTLPAILDNLGTLLVDRYSSKGSKADLEEAIDTARQALAAGPHEDSRRALLLDNLGVKLGRRHWGGMRKSKIVPDNEEAISVTREAVRLTPDNHPALSGRWKNLGTHLGHKYLSTDTATELAETIQCHLSALEQTQSPTLHRITAAREALVYCADVPDWQQAHRAAAAAVDLFPKLIFRSLRNSDKLYMLGQVAGLASDACAVALNAGCSLPVALSLLEQGRAVLSQSTEEMRADLASLRHKHPHLVDRLASLRDALDDPLDHSRQIDDSERLREANFKRKQEADEKLEAVLGDIRKESEFEDFLLAPSEAEMKGAATKGPIVVVNVSQFRCDAIIVENDKMRLVALPKLKLQDVEDLYQIRTVDESYTTRGSPKPKFGRNIWEALALSDDDDDDLEPSWPDPQWGTLKKKPKDALGSRNLLLWLWKAVASPVLEALGLTHTPTQDSWPHIWWVPTGSLTKFPIHAAGNYFDGSSDTVLDRAISSYSPSIKSIIHGRRRPVGSSTTRQALLVAMENTPGQYSKLPFATQEVALLHDLCKSLSLHPVEPKPQKQDILSHLRQCTVFHFAGHGHTDNEDPLKSHLLLDDGSLTVASILELRLHDDPPFLAFLSACGTGRIMDERFTDENIHLISACQQAGFRHVVGTLWEVSDESCVDVARITYEAMRDGGMTDESVSRGLHDAALCLRNRWSTRRANASRGRGVKRRKTEESGPSGAINEHTHDLFEEIGESEVRDGRKATVIYDDEDEEDTEPLSWVPYVHFGV